MYVLCVYVYAHAHWCSKHYVRELVQDKLVKLMPCGTKEMLADAMTTSLPYLPFRTHRITRLDATSLRASV